MNSLGGSDFSMDETWILMDIMSAFIGAKKFCLLLRQFTNQPLLDYFER